ncbi:hypothetical protein [Kitasatospora sp. NPDC056531]
MDAARVALIQQLTTAFPHGALQGDDAGWEVAAASLAEDPEPLGILRSK